MSFFNPIKSQLMSHTKAMSRLMHVSRVFMSTAALESKNANKYSPANYVVMGFPSCPYFQRASAAALNAQSASSGVITAVIRDYPRERYHEERVKVLIELGMKDEDHKTSPLVYLFEKNADGTLKPKQFIGGCDSLLEDLKEREKN